MHLQVLAIFGTPLHYNSRCNNTVYEKYACNSYKRQIVSYIMDVDYYNNIMLLYCAQCYLELNNLDRHFVLVSDPVQKRVFIVYTHYSRRETRTLFARVFFVFSVDRRAAENPAEKAGRGAI